MLCSGDLSVLVGSAGRVAGECLLVLTSLREPAKSDMKEKYTLE